MNKVSAPRAKLVELLWQLKQNYDQLDGERNIHFNTLLRDSDFRRELINEAAVSSNRELREIGQSLRVLNTDGELTQSRIRSAPLNPDIAETVAAVTGKKKQNSGRLALAALVLLAVAIGGFVALNPMSGNEQSVRGSLNGEHFWTADKSWLLDGIVYLEAGARLTIEAGTVVKGLQGSALVVTRDATIMARGAAQAPIVFTSAKDAGARQAGDWGGLVLLGNAPVNTRDAQIEGVPLTDTRGMFGGVDSRHNCGVLEYVRIEFAGYEVYANNELNGLTLGGCGSNTIVRHVQVHRASDDGIEVFGGTVDLKHVLISGAADDSLDWDMGWTGRVQFLQVLQYPGIGDNGFEADNRDGRHDVEPVSQPTFYNVTLQSMSGAEKYQRGMTLRRGTGGHFNNMIIDGFSGEAIDIKDLSTVSRLGSGMMSFSGLLIHNIGADGRSFFAAELGAQDDDGGFDELTFFRDAARLGVSPQHRPGSALLEQPEFRLAAQSPAREGAVAVPEGEFWDEAANYLGAVRPGSNTTWMDGWSAFPVH
ncbi:hypothetical protein HCU74_13675 [Spongiibacter sp. KMU-166]|uniref:Right handed beta helix domain-containing protein n=1 Tax=Spongiibacter thalassae TaxID=2721624 RepID=A0ABX1GGY6_9GAMM|nr:hypothetical protein [Spongiibacter thalassae]NKI18460.1 hypothetical protein [Spongiibacter thalassae]